MTKDVNTQSVTTEHSETSEVSNENSNILNIKVSAKLYRILADKAEQEGLKSEELAHELIAEGIVLRAWEILERKSAMKSPSNYGTNNSNSHAHKNSRLNQKHKTSSSPKNRNFFSNNNKRQNKYSSNNNILENNANFIEYVRNQENKNINR